MDKEFNLTFNDKEVDLIYQALLELPAKVSMPTIEKLRSQVVATLEKEQEDQEVTKEKE